MTDTLQTAELEQQAIEILDDYLDGGEYHEYTPLEKKRHAAHILTLINSEVTKKLEAVLAVLPEKRNTMLTDLSNEDIKAMTNDDMGVMINLRLGFNDCLNQVTTAITNLVEGSRASSLKPERSLDSKPRKESQ